MKDKVSREIKVGLITIIGIGLLILGIALGKSISFSSGENIIKFSFPSSNGLQRGEPVVVNGVTRGKVLKVYNHDGKVMVEGELDKISDLNKDASAQITLLEITGGKKIEITPGISEFAIEEGDIIEGTSPPDISGLIAILGDLSADGAGIVKRLDSIAFSVNNLLSDEVFISDIKNTAANASILSNDIRNFTDDNLYKLSDAIDDLALLTTELRDALDGDSANIKSIIENIDITLKNTKKLTTDADIAMKKAESLIDDFSSIANDIKSGKGLVSKVIYDEQFAAELDSTVIMLQKFVNTIKDHGVNVNLRLGTRP